MRHLQELIVMLLGFLAGALVGYGLARLQGFDPFAVNGSAPGLVLTALAGIIGLRLARRWHAQPTRPR